jgi:hypothetical protein
VEPYPFGRDGNPVDASSSACRAPVPPGDPDYPGDVGQNCYLTVVSLAFRAWNRGLAVTVPGQDSTSPFVVWLFNGTRWYPDPTFPGPDVCPGTTVLWAGKLDYWLVGRREGAKWPRLCRFDGVNFAWQPLDLPEATLRRITVTSVIQPGSPARTASGAISSGACLAWDNCWFFGSYGAIVHWDGNVLADASPQLGPPGPDPARPWISAPEYTAAIARLDQDGRPFGAAAGTTGGSQKGEQVEPRDDGPAPPQLWGSRGGPFSLLPFSPPTDPQPGDPYRTDLVAVDFDPQGRGWLAGDPVGSRPGFTQVGDPPVFTSSANERRSADPAVAPIVPISAGGGPRPGCDGPRRDRFVYSPAASSADNHLWSSLSVFPDSGDALVGGQMRPGAAATSLNDDGVREPALAEVTCRGAVTTTRFAVPDPTANPATAPIVPAARGGLVTSVAANAANDAWAATTAGQLKGRQPGNPNHTAIQRPRLYRLTDGAAPRGRAGDDDEPRPIVLLPDPDIFIDRPPEPEPAPAPDVTVTRQAPPSIKQVKLKAAVYRVVISKPRRTGPRTFVLVVRFRVRRPVTIGMQALRGRRVVSSSGLKRFKGARGKLTLKLDRRRWPTRLRFVSNGTTRAFERPLPEGAQR